MFDVYSGDGFAGEQAPGTKRGLTPWQWAIVGLRAAGVCLALAYIGWVVHHEYSLKYLWAGSLNMAAWRALNAPTLGDEMNGLTDAELGIPRHPVRCDLPPDQVALPANCDFFGGDFGGKSRNCPYWWLGRQCFVFFVPKTVFDKPVMRQRLVHALKNPCSVLQDPARAAKPKEGILVPYEKRAWGQFGCGGGWLDLQRETKLHIVDSDGRFVVETIEMN